MLERLDTARDRNEGVAKHEECYRIDLGKDVQFYCALFGPKRHLYFDRDLGLRLAEALDRALDFDDAEPDSYDIHMDGAERFSPGIAWAFARCRLGHQVAVLPLPLGRAPSGRVSVTVGNDTADLFFVTRESEHVDFCRSVITLENANAEMFKCLEESAFPALEWADNV
ncbi:MAG: hypothetical protein OXC26_00155 [Albidovulum sp.]|nr:hypothetical protein [Albidovulum sp.]